MYILELLRAFLITGANSVMLQVDICQTQTYDEHFHGYVVSRSSQLELIAVDSLLTYFSTTLMFVSSEQSMIHLVTPKFHIADTI